MAQRQAPRLERTQSLQAHLTHVDSLSLSLKVSLSSDVSESALGDEARRCSRCIGVFTSPSRTNCDDNLHDAYFVIAG